LLCHDLLKGGDVRKSRFLALVGINLGALRLNRGHHEENLAGSMHINTNLDGLALNDLQRASG
jgi:hypothetical protein